MFQCNFGTPVNADAAKPWRAIDEVRDGLAEVLFVINNGYRNHRPAFYYIGLEKGSTNRIVVPCPCGDSTEQCPPNSVRRRRMFARPLPNPVGEFGESTPAAVGSIPVPL